MSEGRKLKKLADLHQIDYRIAELSDLAPGETTWVHSSDTAEAGQEKVCAICVREVSPSEETHGAPRPAATPSGLLTRSNPRRDF